MKQLIFFSILISIFILQGCKPPRAPSGLVISHAYNDTKLEWQDKSFNENGFYVYRRHINESNWEQIKALGKNKKNFTDTENHFEPYCYKVSSFIKYTWPQDIIEESFSNVVSPPDPARLPFHEDFENGELKDYWIKYSVDGIGSDEVGIIRVTSEDNPNQGGYYKQ